MVTNQSLNAAASGKVQKPLSLGQVGRYRLFDQQVYAVLGTSQTRRRVPVGRRGNNGSLGRVFGQKRLKALIERHAEFLGRGRPRRIGVTYGHQGTLGADADQFHMSSTNEAGTDDGQFYRLHIFRF